MAYKQYYFKERTIDLKEIGEYLKSSREEKGISIEEASEDLKLDKIVLEQIELGNKDVFKDIYELRSCINAYSKYLCLDCEKIMDEFNEFLFEYTSKIPVGEIETATNKTETESKKIISPYTMEETFKKEKNLKRYIIFGIVLVLVVILLIILL